MSARRQAERVLRAYPAAWRQAHGEALIGTLLDLAEGQGRDRLTQAERADVVAQGLAERVRSLTVDPLWRGLSGAAVALGGALALAGLIVGELARAGVTHEYLAAYVAADGRGWSNYPHVLTTGLLVYPAWLALPAAVLIGPARWVRRIAVLTVLLSAVAFANTVLASLPGFTGLDRPPSGILVTLGWLAAVVALAPAPARRRAAVLGPVGALLLGSAAVTLTLPTALATRHEPYEYVASSFYLRFVHGPLGLEAGLWLLPVVVVALTLLMITVAPRVRRRPVS
jgi:hypothetical protein